VHGAMLAEAHGACKRSAPVDNDPRLGSTDAPGRSCRAEFEHENAHASPGQAHELRNVIVSEVVGGEDVSGNSSCSARAGGY
jgi:hypothetical protein